MPAVQQSMHDVPGTPQHDCSRCSGSWLAAGNKRHLREGGVFGRQALCLLDLFVQLGEQLVSCGLQAANLALQRLQGLRGGSFAIQGGDLAAG